MVEWGEHAEREITRYRDGEARLPEADEPDLRQKQLTRMGNAAGGAGLAFLMQGDEDQAGEWFHRAADRYQESMEEAPPGSWGRPIGAMKALVLAADWDDAEDTARWTLELGSARHRLADRSVRGDPRSPDPRRGRRRRVPSRRRCGEREDFPQDVADSLATLAANDRLGYAYAVESVLESFAKRDEYLEDIPVADTVLVLQALAERRDLAAELSSPLLPSN